MIGVAVGNTPLEIRRARTTADYPYPIVPDEDFETYFALSGEGTPMTYIVDTKGTVHYSHLGAITDVDVFFEEIRKIVK